LRPGKDYQRAPIDLAPGAELSGDVRPLCRSAGTAFDIGGADEAGRPEIREATARPCQPRVPPVFGAVRSHR